MIRLTLQDQQETADFEVIAEPLITRPLIAETDVQTIDNNISTYITGTTKRQLEVNLGFVDAEAYERLRGFRDRQYSLLKYPTVTITTDTPISLGSGEDVPDYKSKIVELKGKNLFNKDNAKELNAYVYSSTGVLTSVSVPATVYISCEPNTVYTVSKSNTGTNNRFCVFETDVEPAVGVTVLSSVGTRSGEDNNTSYTITTSANAHYLGVFFRVTSTTPSKEDIEATIQIEKGSEATTYEEYYDIELCKIGSWQDELYKEDDNWMLSKKVGKKVVTGEESNIDMYSGMTRCPISGWANGQNAILLSNYFSFGYTNNSGRCYVSTANRIAMGISDISVLDDAIEWLKEHKPVFYGRLSSASVTQITNPALIAQLNELEATTGFDDWTQIETEVGENKLHPILTVAQGSNSGTGEIVRLNNTNKEEELSFALAGNTVQQQYNTRNIWSGELEAGGLGTNGRGLNRTDRFNSVDFIPVEPNTTYTFTALPSTASKTINAWFLAFNASKDVVGALPANSWQTCPFSFTTGSAVAYVKISGRYSDDTRLGTAGEIIEPIFEAQLVASSLPIPNSDNPIPIGTVAETLKFKISGPSGRKKYNFTGKMTLSEERIVDLCGTHEQVSLSIRESEQL